MAIEQDVIGSGSSADDNQDHGSIGEGDSLDSGGLSAEAKEILRKKDKAIEDLKGKLSERESKLNQLLEEKQDRLDELADKTRLTADDRDEIAVLQAEKAKILAAKEAKPWLEINKESSTKIAEKAKLELSMELAKNLFDDYAEAEKVSEDKVKMDKFDSEISLYMKRVDPTAEMNPYTRLKKAYKVWREDKAYRAEKEEQKNKDKNFADAGRSASPRPQSKKEIIEQGFSSPKGMEEMLRGISEVHKEATTR